MNKQLKNKTLIFEQDYIETEIKWDLKLGDKIFKKSDVKIAVELLKETIKSKENISIEDINKIIDSSFYDIYN